VLVAAGFSQPLEWAEFPLVVAAFVVLAFILMAFEFVLPFLKARLSDLYISGWYIIGGIVFTMLAYPVGNLVPWFVPGCGAQLQRPLDSRCCGSLRNRLPLRSLITSSRYHAPSISSHFLSMVGFWLLFFVYPLNGTHHYVYSAIPWRAERCHRRVGLSGNDVILVVTNLLLSLPEAVERRRRTCPAFRLVWCRLLSCSEFAGLGTGIHARQPFIHFTDFVIGHSHLAMIGFASFIALGGIAHLWQRIPGTRYNERMMNWSFWLLAVGLTLMVTDLTIAGLVEAQVWQSSAHGSILSERSEVTGWCVRSRASHSRGLCSFLDLSRYWAKVVRGYRV